MKEVIDYFDSGNKRQWVRQPIVNSLMVVRTILLCLMSLVYLDMYSKKENFAHHIMKLQEELLRLTYSQDMQTHTHRHTHVHTHTHTRTHTHTHTDQNVNLVAQKVVFRNKSRSSRELSSRCNRL